MRAEERKRLLREKRIHQYDGVIAEVHDRKKHQEEEEKYRLRERLWEETRQSKRESKSAVIVSITFSEREATMALTPWTVASKSLPWSYGTTCG